MCDLERRGIVRFSFVRYGGPRHPPNTIVKGVGPRDRARGIDTDLGPTEEVTMMV